MINFNDIKGLWVHVKSGTLIEVVSYNPRDDKVGIRRNGGRQSDKKLHYFMEEYKRPEGWTNAMGTETKPLNQELVEALRRMRTEFFAHDCLGNVDCRRCKALDLAEAVIARAETYRMVARELATEIETMSLTEEDGKA